MNSDDEQPVNLESIIRPCPPPPSQADRLTVRESRQAVRNAEKLTPTDRLALQVELHIKDICKERDRLKKKVHVLQSELDMLRPRLSVKEEALSSANVSNIFSTIMIGIGGSLISGAGYAPNDVYKIAILFAGVASFSWGIVFLVASTWRSVILRGSPSSPSIQPILQDSRDAGQLPPLSRGSS